MKTMSGKSRPTSSAGISLAGTNDLVEGDIIECFTQQMVSRTG